MRVLTIRQPYPEATIRGLKGWDIRSWRTLYRGPVAIHAAARWEPGWRNVWVDLDRAPNWQLERYEILTDQLGLEPTEASNDPRYWAAWDGDRIPTGALVAVADLTDSVPIRSIEDDDLPPCIAVGQTDLTLWEVPAPDGEVDISDQLPYGRGYWEPGNWAWRLENVVRLPTPIPARGRLGLWNPHGYPLPGDPDGDLGAEIVRALET